MKLSIYLPLPIVPAVCVLAFRALRLAQGERVEEVAWGIIIGLGIDAVYLFILWIVDRIRR